MNPEILQLLMSGSNSLQQKVLGGSQMIMSALQRRQAEKFFQKNKFKTPRPAITAAKLWGEAASQNELPGASLYRQNALRGLSSGIEASQRTAESSGDVSRNISGFSRGYSDFEKNMAIAAGQQKMQNRAQQASALQNLANWDFVKYQENMNKYNQMLGMAEQYAAAGNQNWMGGANTEQNAASSMMSMQNQQNQFQQSLNWMNNYNKAQRPTSTQPNFYNNSGGFGLPKWNTSNWRTQQMWKPYSF